MRLKVTNYMPSQQKIQKFHTIKVKSQRDRLPTRIIIRVFCNKNQRGFLVGMLRGSDSYKPVQRLGRLNGFFLFTSKPLSSRNSCSFYPSEVKLPRKCSGCVVGLEIDVRSQGKERSDKDGRLNKYVVMQSNISL